MEKAPQTLDNIPSVAIQNLKDTEAILKRVKTIKDSLVAGLDEEKQVVESEPHCLKDLLREESYTLSKIMEVLSEIEKELL